MRRAVKIADISRRHHLVPSEMMSEGQAQKYHEREPGNEVEIAYCGSADCF